MRHTDLVALRKIGNMTPQQMRLIIYAQGPFISRGQVGKLYPTRGDLVAETYALFLENKLPHITRDLDLPCKHQAGVP
jgi:hypothetical protein